MIRGSLGNSHAPAAEERAKGWLKPPFPRPLVLGHRGSPRESVENTLSSFDLALRRDADGVELDVRSARDGIPVVIHDDSLERTMGVRGRVSRLAWPAVQKRSAARVPSLEQVAAWAAASGAWLNVELKSAGIEAAVLERIRAVGIAARTVFSSFDPGVVRRLGELDDGVRRYFLTERWDDAAQRSFGASRAEGVCLRDDAADEAALAELRAGALPVIVWTVNEPARVRALLGQGAAAIITDLPAMAAKERDRHLRD